MCEVSLSRFACCSCSLTDCRHSSDYIYIGFAVLFLVDIVVRLVGLGWSSYIQNGWNIFDSSFLPTSRGTS